MERFVYTIKVADGLHARPAGALLTFAKTCSSSINILKNGKPADAKRLFAIMGLGIVHNDEVTFTVEGPEEKADCEKLKAFCEENL